MTERIPLAVPDLRGREAEYLQRCIEENWVSSAGSFVREFEQQVAALSSRDHGVATASGTTALQLALTALGIGAGDLVALPDWTFAATANAVVHAGATPLFLDVAADSWTLDPEILAKALKHYDGGIKAVIPVHALGHAADLDPILEICGAAEIPVIEDAAGALAARYKEKPVGSFGRAAMFSFNGNKTVTAGGGGVIATDDPALAKTMRHLSTQARTGSSYAHDAIGFNFRMTNLAAAVGLAQLERLDEMLDTKRAIAQRYDAALAARTDLSPMPRNSWAQHSCWLYSVATASNTDTDSLVAHLAARSIEARPFWLSLSPQAPYRAMPRMLAGVSRSLSGRIVSLPCSSSLTDAQQMRVVEALHGWRGSKLPAAA